MNLNEKHNPILILTALAFESRTILSHHKKNIKPKKLTTYQLAESTYLVEVPIGFKFDQLILNREIERISPKLVINFGICGALDSAIPIGSPFRVERVCHLNEENREFKLSAIESPFQSASLLTVGEPVLKIKRRDELLSQTRCQLVDMEAFNIARFCEEQSIPLLIVKVASDLADEDSMNVIRTNRSELKRSLTNAYEKLIRELSQ